MDLMLVAQQFCSNVVLPTTISVSTEVAANVANVAAATSMVQEVPSVSTEVAANVAAATAAAPDMPMTRHIIKSVNTQIELQELVKQQLKFLYLLEGRPPVMSQDEYGIMAKFVCDNIPTERQYRNILFSLLDDGTSSYYYVKAMK